MAEDGRSEYLSDTASGYHTSTSGIAAMASRSPVVPPVATGATPLGAVPKRTPSILPQDSVSEYGSPAISTVHLPAMFSNSKPPESPLHGGLIGMGMSGRGGAVEASKAASASSGTAEGKDRFVFKVRTEDGALHRVESSATELAPLRAAFTAKVAMSGERPFILGWTDPDGDMTALTTDRDLQDAVAAARRAGQSRVLLTASLPDVISRAASRTSNVDPTPPAKPLTTSVSVPVVRRGARTTRKVQKTRRPAAKKLHPLNEDAEDMQPPVSDADSTESDDDDEGALSEGMLDDLICERPATSMDGLSPGQKEHMRRRRAAGGRGRRGAEAQVEASVPGKWMFAAAGVVGVAAVAAGFAFRTWRASFSSS